MENSSSSNKPTSESFEPEENLNNNSHSENYGAYYQQAQNQFEGIPKQPYRNSSYEAAYSNNDQQQPRTSQTGFGNYQNYFGSNNSKVWQNGNFGVNEFKRMRNISIASINIFIVWFILAIVLVALSLSISTIEQHSLLESLISYLKQPSSSGTSPSSPSTGGSSSGDSTMSAIQNAQLLFALDRTLVYFEAIFGIFWGLAVLISGIIGSVRALEISKKSDSFIVIMFLYILGIFIPPFQVMAAFISLSKIKEYLFFI